MLNHVLQQTFLYDSSYWTDRKSYGIPEGKTGLDQLETKLPSYWATPFTKICLGMRIGVETRFYLLNKTASSLYSLIQDGKYRETNLGRNEWKKLIGSQASLQPNCEREGFNVLSGNTHSSKARIGIMSNNENDCITSDSRIRFGTGGYPDHTNTRGNVAKHGEEGGDKFIEAMAYIFVQWESWTVNVRKWEGQSLTWNYLQQKYCYL